MTLNFLLALSVLVSTPPVQAKQPHEAILKQAFDLLVDNKAAQAIALLDPVVAKNPASPELHEMLGSAHSVAAELLEGDAAAAEKRRRHLSAAGTHFKRTIELTHVNRASNLDSLVEIYLPEGLNDLRAAEVYARRLVDDHPSLVSGYPFLARILAETGRTDQAAALLARARDAVPADSQKTLAVHLAQQVKKMPPSATAGVAVMLNEAMRIADATIAASPKDGQLLMFKSMLLEMKAMQVEPDGAGRAAALAESKRLWEAGRATIDAGRTNEPPPPPPAPRIPPDAEARHRAGVEAWDKVNQDKNMPAANARKLLKEAVAAFDDALKLYPDYMEAVAFKSLTLRLDATRYEKDPNRVKELTAEADRLRARAIEMQKRR